MKCFNCQKYEISDFQEIRFQRSVFFHMELEQNEKSKKASVQLEM